MLAFLTSEKGRTSPRPMDPRLLLDYPTPRPILVIPMEVHVFMCVCGGGGAKPPSLCTTLHVFNATMKIAMRVFMRM